MPYNANIPQPTDRLNASQPQILANFTQLQTDFGINHVTYNALGDVGKHNVVTFPLQAAQPAAFGATEMGMYNFTSPFTGAPEVYMRRAAAAGGYPITAGEAASANQAGYTFLPSGLLVKFGYAITVGAGIITTSFTADAHFGPAFLDAPFMTASVFNNVIAGNFYSCQLQNIAVANFTVRTCRVDTGAAQAGITVYWVAFGRPA